MEPPAGADEVQEGSKLQEAKKVVVDAVSSMKEPMAAMRNGSMAAVASNLGQEAGTTAR